MTESVSDELNSKRKDFICGVVEGFYGRPWTTEQRKDLFQKLKKWGMDMYVYAPKDDYKHRAYWRELYTVEEAEHLTSLISAAKAQGIVFCYALSPGLDITYSSQKEITTLKRKLEQVSQFGCTCFALLFDDIEPEMSEADKQIFQSFAHAQVSVTNEVHQHLGCPRFLLCPTQYCSTRAVPTVNNSEYLNTLGSKLEQQIDIMWTGPKVISKTLTTECIEEITQVLRRPPVIWDNLHANDYDQKRIFLGPYCGRSPELIPLLRGVLSNPNCEYNANLIPIMTLAHWASCSLSAPAAMEAVSWDIKLERESEQGVCEDDVPPSLGKNVYHHRQALRLAIDEWLPEFSIPKTAQGPVIKPQPPVTAPPVPMIPILPSINTCMSLITPSVNTASVASTAAIPTVSASQLRALATPGGSVMSPAETFNPVSNPVMNSLVSPTKVILNESIPNPIVPLASCNMELPREIPVSTLPIPVLGACLKNLEESVTVGADGDKDQVMDKDECKTETDNTVAPDAIGESEMKNEPDAIIVDQEDQPQNGEMSVGASPSAMSPRTPHEALQPDDVTMHDTLSENGSMQVEPSNSPLSTDMMVEPTEPAEVADEHVEEQSVDVNALTVDDLLLLCDLFYLPFEHGARGLRLLHDFNWLLTHASSILPRGNKPETSEWRRRSNRFAWWISRVRRLLRRLQACANKELLCELKPYVWELSCVLALLCGFVRWLELGKFPPNITSHIQGSYTWFSKGWREAFESGVQEPWVFRGGLTADLRRLLPVECSGDVLRVQCVPDALPLTVRPYMPPDEQAVSEICHKTCRDGGDCSDLFPSDLQTLPADRLVAPFLTLQPELCMVIEEEGDEECNSQQNGTKPAIVGYACAALNSKEFYKRQEIAWIPEMCNKYPEELTEREDLSQAAKECIRHFHQFSQLERAPATVTRSHPALLTCCVLPPGAPGHCAPTASGAPSANDPLAHHRLITCLLAALRANGATGVHACINSTDHYLHQFYTRLGFSEAARAGERVYLARAF